MTTDDPYSHDTPSRSHNEGSTPWDLVLARLDRVQQVGGRVTAACPAHDDQRNSLSIGRGEDGTVLLHCFVGCTVEQIVSALGLSLTDLFPANRSAQVLPGLTLERYALAKRLSPEFLTERFKLRTTRRKDQLCVEMPSFDEDGQLIATTYRMRLTKTDGIDARFERKKGDLAIPYGLWRLTTARERGFVTLVEGESDVQTLAFYDEPALGVAGANAWKDERDAPALDGIETIFLVVERDRGGAVLKTTIARSPLRPRVRTIDLGELKDPSGLHCDDPDRFRERWALAKAAALPLPDPEDTTAADAQVAFALARDLLHAPDLLDQIQRVITARGYAGDTTPVMAAYIAITSRLLATPMNVAFVAPSGAGKNRAVDEARALMPEEAVYVIKAASERALIYNQEQFRHRTVIFAEADSIPEEGPAASAVRNLATDNVMEYEVTIRDDHSGDFTTRLIRKPGPTGLITTSIRSPGEQLGTRLLEFAIPDDEAQTRAVMHAQARRAMAQQGALPDCEPFLALQCYLALRGLRDMVVPFAGVLADLVPASAVRTRRDFPQLLTAIQTVAFLQQAQRERTADGQVIATIDDYAQARTIFAPCFDVLAAEGVTPRIRELVAAVPEEGEVTLHELATQTGLAESTVSYHVTRAVKRGWLTNEAPRGRRGYKLRRGSPLPMASSALPDPDHLRIIFESSTTNRDEGEPPSPEQNADGDAIATTCQEPAVLADIPGPSNTTVGGACRSEGSDQVSVTHSMSPLELQGATSSRLCLEDSKISLVADPSDLRLALRALRDVGLVGIDCETTGLDPHRDALRLVTIATSEWTIVIDVPAIPDWAVTLAPLLVDPKITKVFQNAKFDLAFLSQAGLTVEPVFDTMIASQLLDAGVHTNGVKLDDPSGTTDRGGKPVKVGYHALTAVAYRWLGETLDKTQQVSDWSGPLTDEQLVYAAKDAAILLPLHAALDAALTDEGLSTVAALEFAALPAMVWMEAAGAPLDVTAWTRLRDEAAATLATLDADLAAVLPGINVDSSTQLPKALAALGVTIPNAQEATLRAVVDRHPVVDLLLRRKEVKKRVSTYGDGYLAHVHPATKRIHATYRLIGAASGRMSCSTPNLQNIPRDPAYRRCIRPAPGRVLVKADYSQIELRIAAQISGDASMQEAFRTGEDLHTKTARAVLGREPTKQDRQLAKALNFGLLYGMGAPRLQSYAETDYGVTLTSSEAARFRNQFFRTYPDLRWWHAAQRDGEITTTTLAGRPRHKVKNFTDKLNSPVQGTGADILKLALARLWNDRAAVPSVALVLVVHDEIVLEVDAAEAEAARTWVIGHMTAAGAELLTDVPVEVDAVIVADWSGTPVEHDAAQQGILR